MLEISSTITSDGFACQIVLTLVFFLKVQYYIRDWLVDFSLGGLSTIWREDGIQDVLSWIFGNRASGAVSFGINLCPNQSMLAQSANPWRINKKESL